MGQTESPELLDISDQPEIQSKENRFVAVSWWATIRELRASPQHISATAESTTFGRLTLDQNKSFSANWSCRDEVLVKVVAPAVSTYE